VVFVKFGQRGRFITSRFITELFIIVYFITGLFIDNFKIDHHFKFRLIKPLANWWRAFKHSYVYLGLFIRRSRQRGSLRQLASSSLCISVLKMEAGVTKEFFLSRSWIGERFLC